MAQALGIRLLDENHEPLGFGGGELSKLHRINMRGLDPRLAQVRLEVACDVDNPLCGPQGASQVFGPQKARRLTWLNSSIETWHTTQA